MYCKVNTVYDDALSRHLKAEVFSASVAATMPAGVDSSVPLSGKKVGRVSLTPRKRTKTEKARESEEQSPAGVGGDDKSENSRRKPRTSELSLHDRPPTLDDLQSRALKFSKKEKMPQSGSMHAASDKNQHLHRNMAETSEGTTQGEMEKATSEAQEAWGAAAALMELFSRVDDKKTAHAKLGVNEDGMQRHEDGMPPPPPPALITPRSNPHTPRGVRAQSTPRGNTPHRGTGIVAERVAAGLGERSVSMKSPKGGGGGGGGGGVYGGGEGGGGARGGPPRFFYYG